MGDSFEEMGSLVYILPFSMAEVEDTQLNDFGVNASIKCLETYKCNEVGINDSISTSADNDAKCLNKVFECI